LNCLETASVFNPDAEAESQPSPERGTATARRRATARKRSPAVCRPAATQPKIWLRCQRTLAGTMWVHRSGTKIWPQWFCGIVSLSSRIARIMR